MAAYITTFTGIHMTPVAPAIEQIDIRDIAHSLSLQCRANGHYAEFFSVAQHCINCMQEAKARGLNQRIQLACLIHDASEAYVADVPRPVKLGLPNYIEMEERLIACVFQCFLGEELTKDEEAIVYEIDDAMLYHEFLALKGEALLKEAPVLVGMPDFDGRMPKEAEQWYLDCFEECCSK